MTTRMIGITLALGWLGLATIAPAAEGKKNKNVQTGSITGTVVDVACSILGEKPGPGHKGCAEGGVPVGLVDGKGKLWLAINDQYGSATAMLVPFMGQKVRATGWYVVHQRDRLISIASVEPVTDTKAAATGKAAVKESWICPHECGGKGDHAGPCPQCGMEMVKKKS